MVKIFYLHSFYVAKQRILECVDWPIKNKYLLNAVWNVYRNNDMVKYVHVKFSCRMHLSVFMHVVKMAQLKNIGLRYSQTIDVSFVGPFWNDIWLDLRREIMLGHNAQRHLGRSENWIFCVSLATSKFNIWLNILSRICQSIGCHFICSVDTLITWANTCYLFILCKT